MALVIVLVFIAGFLAGRGYDYLLRRFPPSKSKLNNLLRTSKKFTVKRR
jgi:hypothetical protein